MTQPLPAGARRGIRRRVRMECELVSAREDDPLRFPITDLSPYGMWLQTPDPVRAGEQVVVCFEPHDSEPSGQEPWRQGELMVFAEVARVATSRRRVNEPGVGMGLEFLDLTPDEHRALDRWLAPRKSPVPRRRRPTPRYAVPAPAMTRSFDEIRGTTVVHPVHAPPLASATASSVEKPCLPLDFRPLESAWR